MTVSRLLVCRFCSQRVRPVDAVHVGDSVAHPDCADAWYARVRDSVD